MREKDFCDVVEVAERPPNDSIEFRRIEWRILTRGPLNSGDIGRAAGWALGCGAVFGAGPARIDRRIETAFPPSLRVADGSRRDFLKLLCDEFESLEALRCNAGLVMFDLGRPVL